MPSDGSPVLFRVSARGLSRRSLAEFARRLKDEVAGGREFCCLISDDAELQRLNREFRRRDYPTDVLSFPVPPRNRNGALGEIAISYDRARQQALEHGHDTADELRILLLHGVLHLTGLDHERDTGRMARVEKRWRKHFGLPAGLIERVRA